MQVSPVGYYELCKDRFDALYRKLDPQMWQGDLHEVIGEIRGTRRMIRETDYICQGVSEVHMKRMEKLLTAYQGLEERAQRIIDNPENHQALIQGFKRTEDPIIK